MFFYYAKVQEFAQGISSKEAVELIWKLRMSSTASLDEIPCANSWTLAYSSLAFDQLEAR